MIFSQKVHRILLKEDPVSKQCVLVSALWSRREEQISRRSFFFPGLQLQSSKLSPYQFSNDLQSLGEWSTVFCQQTMNRFHIFICSGSRRMTASGVVLHILPSISKASIPPIHISMTYGSATISLINQFNAFHSTFTGFNTKFNCHSLLLHDADDKAKNLHLPNKFVLTDHWMKTIEAWSHVTWSIVLRSYGVGR